MASLLRFQFHPLISDSPKAHLFHKLNLTNIQYNNIIYRLTERNVATK